MGVCVPRLHGLSRWRRGGAWGGRRLIIGRQVGWCAELLAQLPLHRLAGLRLLYQMDLGKPIHVWPLLDRLLLLLFALAGRLTTVTEAAG